MSTPRARLGNRGEDIARRHLLGLGWHILETNYRSKWGEVDIVAQEGDQLVFVEVRTRQGSDKFGGPKESVTHRKKERLQATAETYIQQLDEPPADWRIDLIAVVMARGGPPQIEHVTHAVELG